jgi:hypothetical protein
MSITAKEAKRLTGFRLTTLNELTGSPTERYDSNGNQVVGHFFIEKGYGGFCFFRTDDSISGQSKVGTNGYISTVEMFYSIDSFIECLEYCREHNIVVR